MEVTHETTSANDFRNGVTLVSMTAVRLVGLDQGGQPLAFKLHRGLLVRCPGSSFESDAGVAVNTHPVWIGGQKTVSPDTGMALIPGASIVIPIDDPSELWIITTGVNQRVAWMSL